tara:strand:- start:880 stop:1608 length:729 start_codon:yes stop_codon:yes gene_type:complete
MSGGVFIHTGTNVVANVILTKKGRESFAAGQLPVSFALFDDGVDYALWDPAAANPGAAIEAIPLLEPSTAQEAHPQYRLLSLGQNNLTFLPIMQFLETSVAITEQDGAAQSLTAQIHYNQAGFIVPASLVDTKFVIECDSKFLSVLKNNVVAPVVATTPGGVARYVLDADSGSSRSGGGTVGVSLLDNVLTDIDWQTYGSGGGTIAVGSRAIRTQVRVRGVESGIQGVILVTITEKVGLHAT